MASLQEKGALILEHEKKFADTLASQVLEKPRLSVWMILIPIFFVYFFYRYQRYIEGRKAFSEHYLVSRRRALNEAIESTRLGTAPDINALAERSDMPEIARSLQKNVLGLLVAHYSLLLNADGEEYSALIRSAYGTRTNYLLFLNRLNKSEIDVNASLSPHLKDKQEGVEGVISLMESRSEAIRRENAEVFFP